MARKRFITSDMSTDERLGDIAIENPMAALMWPWFLTAFDDWGRMDVSSPGKIKLELFPAFPFGIDEIKKAIELFSEVGIVHKYTIDKKTYLAIEPCKYYKYQTYIRDEKRVKDKSNIPAPENAPWDNCAHCRALARKCIPSPSPSPSREREIDARARDNTPQEKSQENFDTEIAKINNKAFEFGMSRITPEFIEDAEMRLSGGTDPELIIKALSIGATKANGNTGAKCRYAISVLQGWAQDGIRTLAQWQAKNAPEPKARDKPMKTKAQEREEAFQKSKEEAYRKLREQGVVLDDAR